MTPLGDAQDRFAETSIPSSFPATFSVGGGLGGSQVSDWTLRVWLAVASNELAPGVGAPHAEAIIDTYCAANGSCQFAYVDLTLAP
jgi:hypothetical protein